MHHSTEAIYTLKATGTAWTPCRYWFLVAMMTPSTSTRRMVTIGQPARSVCSLFSMPFALYSTPLPHTHTVGLPLPRLRDTSPLSGQLPLRAAEIVLVRSWLVVLCTADHQLPLPPHTHTPVSCSADKSLKIWQCYRPGNTLGVCACVGVDVCMGVHVSHKELFRVLSYLLLCEGVPVEGKDPKWCCVCTLSGYHTREVYDVAW